MNNSRINKEPLRQMLKKRGVNFAKLAKQADVNRHHLCDVLAGRERGTHVWRRIRECLQWAEADLVREIYGNVFGDE